jgi:hypothetical protein
VGRSWSRAALGVAETKIVDLRMTSPRRDARGGSESSQMANRSGFSNKLLSGAPDVKNSEAESFVSGEKEPRCMETLTLSEDGTN